MTSKITYRSDIDGLRAIAVLSVLFYHAGFKIFSGGYVGVDVFFVISGYLITTIIVREIEADEFSIIKFYERRIRRIYPALYLILLLVGVAAFFLYSPQIFTQTSKSILATVGFVSNFLFKSQSGYFAAPSILQPLLHTWSLAVEEQFYIVFPWLVFLIMRYARKYLRLMLGCIAILSFVLSLNYMARDASAAFYYPHLRAWELLIGGLIAVNALPIIVSERMKQLLSVAGLAMILVSIFAYTEGTLFPGISALLPTLGSALILYSGIHGSSFAGRILSWSPFVFIGKISYSLYLWHWPVIIFGRDYIIKEPNAMQMAALLIIAFTGASFSWLVVEKPFRSRSFLPSPRIFIFSGTIMSFTLALSGVVFLRQGFPERLSQAELATFADDNSVWGRQKKCIEADLDAFQEFDRCMIGGGTFLPSFIVWGDSHAQALAPAIDVAANSDHALGYLAQLGGCPPLLDVHRAGDATCVDFNQKVFSRIASHPEWKTVILAARWAISADGERYKAEDGVDVTLIDAQLSTPPGSNAIIFERGLDRTVRRLLELDRRVIIVSTVPEIGYDVPSAYLTALRTGRDINKIVAPTLADYDRRNAVVIDVLKRLQDHYPIQIVDPSQVLCQGGICQVVLDGQPLYRDAHHLSTFGALYIADIFNSVFEK